MESDRSSIAATPEQERIVTAARSGDDVVIQAVAGSGKTTTLRMIADTTRSRGLYIAYNKATATEAASKFPRNVTCRTAHSLAFKTFGRTYRHRIGGPRQTSKQVAEILGIRRWLTLDHSTINPSQLARIAIETVLRFCHSADDTINELHVPWQRGLGAEQQRELTRAVLPFAIDAWDDVCNTHGLLHFEHDYYLKLWALSRPQLPADMVMLDECQDSNPVLAQVVQSQIGSQVIAVGDSYQQLYAWRGAVDALDQWPAHHYLSLSQSWRFGTPIADEANKWLGLLRSPTLVRGNPRMQSAVTECSQPDAVLCRTNAEAMSQAMTRMADGAAVAIVGGSDIIKRLARAADELKHGRRTTHPELYLFTSWGELQEYADNDIGGRDLKPLVKLIDAYGVDSILAAADAVVEEDKAQVIVSTAHRSKGREWPNVYIAKDFHEPSQDEDGNRRDIPRHDAMLAYVTVTRARTRLDRRGLSWIDNYLGVPPAHSSPSEPALERAAHSKMQAGATELLRRGDVSQCPAEDHPIWQDIVDAEDPDIEPEMLRRIWWLIGSRESVTTAALASIIRTKQINVSDGVRALGRWDLVCRDSEADRWTLPWSEAQSPKYIAAVLDWASGQGR
ncbi:UvrD-helicase domain-containing protein [Gordonia sp. ABSL11-1]|uniref:UvrD-helicase domain-containing protein n=1 Tax=Gordonia sp. ABSL11-1 TaxID=3053924 RepID=UPI0025748E6E|nr:UvrD-helicase domain-containing protein [Gordonia sp. ABSL11-1]MDL9949001.1 UvrD-helicase domain-containing protein [Gordonia sp. ABSL11-1]